MRCPNNVRTSQTGQRSRGAGTAWYGIFVGVASAISCTALNVSGYALFRNSD